MNKSAGKNFVHFAKKIFLLSSLRVRLVLLVFLAVAPSLALIYYNADEQRRIEIDRARNESTQGTKLLTGRADQLVEGARQLLIAVAEVVSEHSDDPAYINRHLGKLLDKFPQYATIGVADQDGNSRFSALAAAGSLNFSDRLWFKRACQSRTFSLGEYTVGRISRKKSVHFSYPVFDRDGKIRFVNYLALDLDWFNWQLSDIQLPRGAILKVIDSKGIILARSPDPEKLVGKAMPEAEVVKTILSQHQGIVEASGLDGIKRIYTFTPVSGTSNNIFVSVGIPREVVFADVDRLLHRNLVLLALVASISLAAALLISAMAKRSDHELTRHREHLELLVKERTSELEQANIRLQELDRLKSMFIASMSHELRTPLNSIIGFSSILFHEWLGPVAPEQKEKLSTILRAGKHLLNLINDVIDVSKIEAGKLESVIEDFDLSELIAEALSLFKNDMDNKGLELAVETIHQDMHTDRRRLLQCVINLISNAVKFTEKGGVRITAQRVEGQVAPTEGAEARDKDEENEDFIEISVADTGIGIREEDMSKLFFAFTRLPYPISLKVKGTGLGLYLTKKITVEILKGDITVKSSYGKGSIFSLRIPVRS